MVPTKSKTLGSWADEVEKDEEAAAITQVYENQKPNPFGAARPREVVLQERGIDSKKLDQDLRAPNSSVCSQKEKRLKENIPASDASIVEIKQMTPQSRRNPEKRKMEYENKIQQGPPYHPNYSSGSYVPPLKYPPRALLPSLFPASQCSYYSPRVFNTQCFQKKNQIELESPVIAFESSRRNSEVFGNTRVLRRQNDDPCYERITPMPDRRRDAVVCNGGIRDDRYKGKSCLQGNCNSRMGMFSAFEKTHRDQIRGESEWKSFPGKCVIPSMETMVRGGKKETRQSKEMQKAEFRGNHKKRANNSGTEDIHYHRKRR